MHRHLSLIIIAIIITLAPVAASAAALVPCGTEKYPPGTTKVIDGKTVDVSGQISNPCTVCHLFVLVKNVVDFATKDVAMPVAVIILVYGGVVLLTSAGSEEKITKGRRALWQAIWGLIIVFAAWLIVDTVIKWFGAGGQGVIQGWGPWNKLPCP